MTYLRPLPQQAYLRECFDYSPDTGTLTWRHRPQHHFCDDLRWKMWNTRYAGTVAGFRTGRGYISVGIDAINYRMHRVIWRLMTDEEPIEIDHVNRVRDDNRWQNLRRVTRLENLHNTARSNKTGFWGVYKTKAKHSFAASIRIAGKMVHLGSFPTAEEASAVYCSAMVLREDIERPS